jgi:hypothetical protein
MEDTELSNSKYSLDLTNSFFFVNVMLICNCYSQIFELCHTLKD